MYAEIDIEHQKCKYPECRHYEDGVCNDENARKDCIAIAMAVMNVDVEKRKKYIANGNCDFCTYFYYRSQVIKDRCDRINDRAHVKTAKPKQGVIIHSYVTDHRTRIYEMQSKTFQKIRFCPQCGFDFKRGCRYDQDNYEKNPKKES